MIAYHFTGPTLRDGRPLPPIGEWLVHDGPVAICLAGLHASRHPRDALTYAPGPLLHRVECEEIVAEQKDKFVCRRRKIIATIDSTNLLWAFARRRALSVIHLWDAPPVVREYLETGGGDLRAAARAAAWNSITRNATRTAAWNAALAAARAASTAWTTVWAASSAAASDASWAAANAAARAASSAASSAAARDAAITQERAEFLEMVEEAFAEETA